MVEPWGSVGGGSTADSERADNDLGNNRADFACGSRQAVGSRAVAGREAFARDDEGGSIRTAAEWGQSV